jgi:TolA-binding protein
MARRAALIITAIVFAIIGGVAVYFALAIPRDIRAEALLRDARANLQKGDNVAARKQLEKIIHDYPRTDAAAAAVIALSRLRNDGAAEVKSSVDTLGQRIDALEQRIDEQQKTITSLQQQIEEAAKKRAEVKPAAPPKPVVKKSAPRRTARRTTRRRRR